MVDDHAIPFEIQEASEQHGAVIHGRDGCSGRDTVVEALMLALGDPVENTLGTVYVGGGGVDRSGKVTVPFAERSDAFEEVCLHLFRLFDLLELLSAGLGKLLFDFKMNVGLGIIRS